MKISPILFSIDFCLNNSKYLFKLGNKNGLLIDNAGLSFIFIYLFEIKYFLISLIILLPFISLLYS